MYFGLLFVTQTFWSSPRRLVTVIIPTRLISVVIILMFAFHLGVFASLTVAKPLHFFGFHSIDRLHWPAICTTSFETEAAQYFASVKKIQSSIKKRWDMLPRLYLFVKKWAELVMFPIQSCLKETPLLCQTVQFLGFFLSRHWRFLYQWLMEISIFKLLHLEAGFSLIADFHPKSNRRHFNSWKLNCQCCHSEKKEIFHLMKPLYYLFVKCFFQSPGRFSSYFR